MRSLSIGVFAIFVGLSGFAQDGHDLPMNDTAFQKHVRQSDFNTPR
jgi:hypothetical protein